MKKQITKVLAIFAMCATLVCLPLNHITAESDIGSLQPDPGPEGGGVTITCSKGTSGACHVMVTKSWYFGQCCPFYCLWTGKGGDNCSLLLVCVSNFFFDCGQ